MTNTNLFKIEDSFLSDLNPEEQSEISGGLFWHAFNIVGGIIGIYTATYAYADAKISKWNLTDDPPKQHGASGSW